LCPDKKGLRKQREREENGRGRRKGSGPRDEGSEVDAGEEGNQTTVVVKEILKTIPIV